MQNRVKTFQYQNRKKSKSNIKIAKISNLPFDIFGFKIKKNDDTVPNAAKINKFLETYIVQNWKNGLTINLHVAFFPAETPDADSDKNMQQKI